MGALTFLDILAKTEIKKIKIFRDVGHRLAVYEVTRRLLPGEDEPSMNQKCPLEFLLFLYLSGQTPPEFPQLAG